MKNKIFSLLSFSIVLLLALTLVSAVSFDKESYSITKNGGSGSFSFSVSNDLSKDLVLSVNNDNFKLSSTNLSAGSNKTITVEYNSSKFNFEDDSEESLKTTYEYILSANDGVNVIDSSTISFEPSYCVYGNKGKISVSVDDEKADNADEWEWKMFNNIELTVNVENNANEDMSGTIEYCLFDVDEDECVISDDFDFDVDEDEDEDFTIDFRLSPSKLNLDSENYVLYVKAYDDDEWDESTQCEEASEEITLNINKDEVMVDKDEIKLPEEISAGDTITLEVPVYNVGSNDQEDVSVKLSSKTLGISTLEESVGDLDVGDDKTISFTFQVPESAVEGKTYEVILEVYDEDGDIYELEDNDGDDYDASFPIYLKITDGASASNSAATSSVSVSAELVGEAKAGEKMAVKAIVQNTGAKSATFSLNALSYGSWADDVSISQSTVQLTSGESKEVTFTFDVKDTASEKNRFTLEVLSENELVLSQSVSVDIEGKTSIFSGLFSSGSSWYLWAIGGFNVLLVIVIILVVVRIIRK